MKNYQLLITIIASCIMHVAQAQDTLKPRKEYPGLILKIDAGDFLSAVPGILISVDHPLNHRFRLSHEIGSVNDVAPIREDPELDQIAHSDISGIKLKEEIRIIDDKSSIDHSGLYYGAGFHYSNVSLDNVPFTAGNECDRNGFGCTYFQRRSGKFKRRTIGGSIFAGYQVLDFKPFVFDFSMGYGLQRIVYTDPDLPEDSFVRDQPDLPGYTNVTEFETEESDWRPMITLAFRVGIIIF